jgi:hypothetical protein
MAISITKRREEILRLIAKVANGGDSGPAPRRLPTATARQDRQDRVAWRRQSLDRTREQREQLEKRLLGEQLLQLHEMLEQRVSALEELVRGGGGPAPAPQPATGSTSRFEQSTLSGTIREGLLADMLQMVSSNMMTGVFTTESNGTEIRLYFNEGEVCHGEGEGLVADNAFFAAMAMEKGRFYFTETDDLPGERTISSKTQFLILEALRQIDESKAQR